jgi:Uma2 family endonuclease
MASPATSFPRGAPPPRDTEKTTETATPSVPPLEGGDRLTRPEFERRYEAMPHLKKAELIEGRVYMPSPVRNKSHGQPHAHLTTWLGVYAAATPGVETSSDATVRLDLDNEPQPDVLLRIGDAYGGASHTTDDDYLAGAPELACEIAASTVSYDLHEKKRAYRRCGVQEYLVWRVRDKRFDWFVLDEGAYRALEPDADGLLESRILPGLRLEADALLAGDLAAVLDAAREGTQTERHAAFTEELDARREA